MGKKINAREIMNRVVIIAEGQIQRDKDRDRHHPDAFHVSGPRNVSPPNWRDLLNSSWNNENYRRTVIACFIQAVYLLETDRQEKRTGKNALAPKWWIPFKYQLVQTLTDEKDGSIFGAVLEWDRASALMSGFVLIRPWGAPRAVLALRGTLLKASTIRRDLEDDLRFLAWESLEGSVRFRPALQALKSLAEKYGSNNVCVAGHSLGAGFALQVGRALAQQGIFVETHLFNPPSVSLAMSLRTIGEKAVLVLKERLKSLLPASTDNNNGKKDPVDLEEEGARSCSNVGLTKWVPHFYVNDSDYICCYYTESSSEGGGGGGSDEDKCGNKENSNNNGVIRPKIGEAAAAAKLFVRSKGKQKFLEAHGLEQWWSDDLDLQMAVRNSKLISRQLNSLYDNNNNNNNRLAAPQQALGSRFWLI